METPRDIFLMQQTYATLFSLTNKIQVKGDEYLKHLTSRQLMTLIAVVHLPQGEASLNNIARMLGATKQSVNQLIAIIQKKGFVAVEPNARDKRSVNIILTEAGKQAMLEDGERGMQLFNNLFHEFTPEEMETLWGMLKKLYRFDGEEQNGFEAEASIQ